MIMLKSSINWHFIEDKTCVPRWYIINYFPGRHKVKKGPFKQLYLMSMYFAKNEDEKCVAFSGAFNK